MTNIEDGSSMKRLVCEQSDSLSFSCAIKLSATGTGTLLRNNILAAYESLQKVNNLMKQTLAKKIHSISPHPPSLFGFIYGRNS